MVVNAQFHTEIRVIDGKEIPSAAYLYRYPSVVIKQAALNVLDDFGVKSFFSGSQEYFMFSGKAFDLVLMNETDAMFWIESMGDESCMLYAVAFKRGTREIAGVLKYPVVQTTVKKFLDEIEGEGVRVYNQLLLTEQYTKVHLLTGQLQELLSDLNYLENNMPHATNQIEQLRVAIRNKRSLLNHETDILNRFKGSMEL